MRLITEGLDSRIMIEGVNFYSSTIIEIFCIIRGLIIRISCKNKSVKFNSLLHFSLVFIFPLSMRINNIDLVAILA